MARSEGTVFGNYHNQCLKENPQENQMGSLYVLQFPLMTDQCPPKKTRVRKSQANKTRRVAVRTMNQQIGHWLQAENKRYHWFLEQHSIHFLQKHLRRMDKIFKSMALFVGTRQAQQCRSHHQKIEKKYNHDFQQILHHLRRINYQGDLALLEQDIRCNVEAKTKGSSTAADSEQYEVIEDAEQGHLAGDLQQDSLADELSQSQLRGVEDGQMKDSEQFQLDVNELFNDDHLPEMFG